MWPPRSPPNYKKNNPPLPITIVWMFMSSQDRMVKSYPKCEGIRRWGLWKVIRLWGWNPHNGIRECPYTRDPQRVPLGFPGGTGGKEPACQGIRHKRHRFNPCVGKIPWRKAWQPTPVFLFGESYTQRSLAGYKEFQRVKHDWNDLTCMRVPL